MKLSDIADFNPRETIKKGEIAKKISMDVLRPFYSCLLYTSEDKDYLAEYLELYRQNEDMVGWIKVEDTKDVYKRQILQGFLTLEWGERLEKS